MNLRILFLPAVMIAAPVLLHVSLLLRLAVGDARGLDAARQIGGALNVVALLGLVATTAGSAVLAGRHRESIAVTPREATVSAASTASEPDGAPVYASPTPPRKTVTSR